MRRDWLEELTRLQDDLPAFPHAVALERIEEELGAPAHELFEEFPDQPIAAASLGQVYKARLQGKAWVAVKVQRPNLTFILRRDLVLIRALGITAPLLLSTSASGSATSLMSSGAACSRRSTTPKKRPMPSASCLVADTDAVYVHRSSGCSVPPGC